MKNVIISLAFISFFAHGFSQTYKGRYFKDQVSNDTLMGCDSLMFSINANLYFANSKTFIPADTFTWYWSLVKFDFIPLPKGYKLPVGNCFMYRNPGNVQGAVPDYGNIFKLSDSNRAFKVTQSGYGYCSDTIPPYRIYTYRGKVPYVWPSNIFRGFVYLYKGKNKIIYDSTTYIYDTLKVIDSISYTYDSLGNKTDSMVYAHDSVSKKDSTIFTHNIIIKDSIVHSFVAVLNHVNVQTPNICLVTTDSNFHNKIFVENPVSSVDSMQVLSQKLSVWKRIGSIKKGQKLQFVDSSSNIKSQSYSYKVVAFSHNYNNSCNLVGHGDSSTPHTTIHVTYFSGNLIWNSYEGLSSPELTGYNVFQIDNHNKITLLGSTPNLTTTSFTVLNYKSNYRYYIEAYKANACDDSTKLHKNGVATIQSNRFNENSSGIAGIEEPEIETRFVNGILYSPSDLQIRIMNTKGQVLYEGITNGKFEVSQKGLVFISLMNRKQVKTIKIVNF